MEFCCARVPESRVNLTVVRRRLECAQPEGVAKASTEVGTYQESEEELSLVCLM